MVFVDSQGFEPQMTEPKSVVLPLHHGSVLMLRNYINYLKYKNENERLIMGIAVMEALLIDIQSFIFFVFFQNQVNSYS
jgi:hypothetical protein